MSQNIDQLNIEIKAGADQATEAIRELRKSVAELKGEMSGLDREGAEVVDTLEGVAKAANLSSDKMKSNSWWNNPITPASGFKANMTVTMIKDLAAGLANSVKRASDLTEVMNLFGVALQNNAEDGLEFIKMLENGLGINALDSANYMAQFYQISHALGLADESALKLSKDFTKLTYDLASLFNVDFETAFQKLRAGLVGETEPLRQLGITITEANLAETARQLGIEKSIRLMTEAEKIELRYVTTMMMARNAMNDFETTQDTLGNGIRKVQAQFQLLAQTIGQVFVPILTRTIPYVIAFIEILGEGITWLASLFGISMEPLNAISSSISSNMSDISSGIDDMDSGLKNATGSANKLKNALMGFDELNVLPSTSGSGGGAGGTGLGAIGGAGLGIDFDKFGYDDYIKAFSDQVSNAKEKLEKLSTAILAVAGFAAGLWGAFKFVKIVGGMGSLIAAVEAVKGAFVILSGAIIANPIAAVVAATTAGLVALAVKGFQPAIKSADIFKGNISEITEQKLRPFMNVMEELDQQLLGFEVCENIITQDDVNELQVNLSKLTNSILEELDADRNKALQDLSLLKYVLTEEEYNELIDRNTAMYDELESSTKKANDRILEIYQKAANEKRKTTEEENKELDRLRQQLLDNAIDCMSEEASETAIIRQRIKNNTLATSMESASAVIKNAAAARDEAIAKAEEQYDGLVNEATKMKLAGAINEEEYNNMVENAKLAKDAAIKEANNQYDGIYDACAEKFPEVTKFIDNETGKIKNKFQVAWEDIKTSWKRTLNWFLDDALPAFGTWCKNMGNTVKDFVNNKIAPWFTTSKWKSIASGVTNGLTSGFKSAINGVIGMVNKFVNWLNSRLRISIPAIEIPGVGKVFDGYNKQLFNLNSIPYLAKGGVIDQPTIAMIGEAGKEAVVPLENNTGWMATVAKGISAELGNVNGESSQPVEVVLQVKDRELGRVVIDSINQLQRQSGRVLLNV